jgi:hypothetical protein
MSAPVAPRPPPTTTAPGISRASSASSPSPSTTLRQHHPPGARSPGRRRGRGWPGHQGPVASSSCRNGLRPRDRRTHRRAQRCLCHQRRAQDGHQGVQHLRAHLRRPAVGGGEPAKGWLLGEVHNGIAQMFKVIENARMMVGTKAIATLVDRLPQRFRLRQDPRAGLRPDPGGRQDRASGHDHPSPRRTPLADDAEVLRRGDALLVIYTASWQDRVRGRARRREDDLAACGSTTCCCRS